LCVYILFELQPPPALEGWQDIILQQAERAVHEALVPIYQTGFQKGLQAAMYVPAGFHACSTLHRTCRARARKDNAESSSVSIKLLPTCPYQPLVKSG
jgi:hypothetical protein